MITKPARDIVVPYKIKNCEYNENHQSTTSTSSTTNNEQTRSLSTHLVQSEKTNDIILKSDLTVPEFLFGASLPLDVAMNQIYDRLNKIVLQIPNATLQEALETSMILGCADAAEMDSLPKKNKHITSYLFVPTLQFLVQKCAFHSSSIYNIYLTNISNQESFYLT